MARPALVLLVLVAIASPRHAAGESVPLPPKFDEAVARGLDFLAKQQLPDGSFALPQPTPPPATTRASATSAPALPTTTSSTTPTTSTAAPPLPLPTTQPATASTATASTAPAPPAAAPASVTAQNSLAPTALVVAAMLSAGNPPDVGRHGLVVRNAIDFLLASVPSGVRTMSDHGLVAFALAEAYGVEADRDERAKIRAALSKLLPVILAAQSVEKSEIHAGGWGATPDARDSTLADTAWNVLALRACRDIGLSVPPDAFARAARYVLRCRNPLDKGFAYQPAGQGNADATGIAIVALNVLEAGSASELPAAQNFLAQVGPRPPARIPYTTMFHTVQAGAFSTDATFAAVSRPIFDALLKAQQSPDGGWPASASPVEEPGRVTATALAMLTLTAAYRLLPLYEK